MKDKTNINEDHNAHHVYIHFSRIIEVSRYTNKAEKYYNIKGYNEICKYIL